MKKTITTFFAAGLLAGSLGLISCDSAEEEAVEEQGEQVEDAGEQMEDSGDDMDDGEGDA